MRVRSTTDRPKGRPTRLTGIKSVFSCDFGLLYYLTSNIPGYCPRSKESPVNFTTKPQNNAAPPHKSSARTLPGCKSPPFRPGAQTGFRSWPARNANSLNGPTLHSPPPALRQTARPTARPEHLRFGPPRRPEPTAAAPTTPHKKNARAGLCTGVRLSDTEITPRPLSWQPSWPT